MIARLTKAVLTVAAQDAVKERVRQIGYDPISGGPELAKQWIARDVPFFKELVKNAKIPQIK